MNMKLLNLEIARLELYLRVTPPRHTTYVRRVYRQLLAARKLALAAQDAYTTGLLPSGCDLHRIARRIK